MKRAYFCPDCRANLNPNVKIILTMVKGDRRGLALLSPQPGNYDMIRPKDLVLPPGELIEIRCPVCHADLTSKVDPNLARIGFERTDGTRGWVDFSRVSGEHATFFVTSEAVHSYGKNAEVYGGVNFFGEGQPDD